MSIPERPQTASCDPRFRVMQTDDGSRTLVDVATGDSFHSGCGAAAECRQVYLENSGSGPRLRNQRPTAVLEIGFGTGMAFVMTAAEAVRSATPLHYVALEHRPLPVEVIAQVLADSAATRGPEYAAVRASLLEKWAEMPAGASGVRNLQLTAECNLRLVLEDAVEWQPDAVERFDAIYFDPFSPASDSRLWEAEVLRRMRTALAPEGRLVSYCVNRGVRERLESVGFHVHRVPGPAGGKREVLIAEPAAYSANWSSGTSSH